MDASTARARATWIIVVWSLRARSQGPVYARPASSVSPEVAEPTPTGLRTDPQSETVADWTGATHNHVPMARARPATTPAPHTHRHRRLSRAPTPIASFFQESGPTASDRETPFRLQSATVMVGREPRLDQVGRSDNARVMDGPEIVEHHGIVLQSARGPVVNLPELVVGGPISGSWWAHPRHDEIFRVLNEASGSEDVVRLRLVEGHLALVHRRLWPALARLRDRIGSDAMASVQEEHTSSGAHRSRTVPFPDWVPPEVLLEAAQLSEVEAIEQIPAGVLPSRPGP